MEEYGKILLIAMPLFLLLIIIEKIYAHYKGANFTPILDSVSSVSSGITNVMKDILGLSITFISYEWLVSKIAIYDLEVTIWTYIIAFICIDFHGYWIHRWSHQINFFWNKHAIHHSSEEFNLACALRQSISSFVNLFTFLLLPAALLGVPPKVIIITLPIQLFMQFWYHTRFINRLGFLEKIIVTPSHHRVHHAINPEYMDKNHSQIFIIWDKLFGTFQEELATVPAVFGITRPAKTWNPIRINFQHLALLLSDAWRAENWKDKFLIWFKPTGWRPDRFEEKYPVEKIKDVYNFEKYNTNSSLLLKYWSVVQMFITLIFVSYLLKNIAQIGFSNIIIYGAFIFLSIYSYTELMDKNKYSIFWEILRVLFGVSILYYQGDWFGLNKFILFGNYLILSYFSVSLLFAFYFNYVEFKKVNEQIYSYEK
jgi:sterol desaturase/sphingolipid hydroxylase (fatty acid hydroxylase superfamily)